MELAELEEIAEASTERFRLETLPTYLVPEESNEFAAWQKGQRSLPSVDEDPWMRHIRDTTRAGAHWWRIRILDYPLAEYTEYELHGYQGNFAAGEDIYVADRAWSADLADLREDFWVFDSTVIRMIYDDQGHFVRPELAPDTAPYFAMRDTAAHYAIPLADYLFRNEPRLIA